MKIRHFYMRNERAVGSDEVQCVEIKSGHTVLLGTFLVGPTLRMTALTFLVPEQRGRLN